MSPSMSELSGTILLWSSFLTAAASRRLSRLAGADHAGVRDVSPRETIIAAASECMGLNMAGWAIGRNSGMWTPVSAPFY